MTSLSRYHSKRHFGKTREPRGKIVAVGSRGRFVVQRHAARRLHFDLRLEIDGVYKSWAVTKVPSLDPAVRRLAVQVEDHPLAYGNFEGTIPKGEYGGGTVQLWDRGRWASQTGNKPSNDLKRGRLNFSLRGEVLKGGWALVRLSRSGTARKQSWLLVKERDGNARPGHANTLARHVHSVKTGRTLQQIAAGSSRVRRRKRLKPAKSGRARK
jgi:bifunctional non-homologous end joining protein LigD